MVDRSRALRGASDADFESGSVLELGFVPTFPTTAKDRGSQFMFAAATVMRPVTKEFPSRAPATTKQTRTAATMPKPGPRSRVIAVCLT